MKKVLSISPWPSVWSQGNQGGSPSERYAIQAMVQAGFHVTHLSPAQPGLSAVETEDRITYVRIVNPFSRYRYILKSKIAFTYRLPAIMEFSTEVSRWIRRKGTRFDLVVGHSSETVYALRRAAKILGVPSIMRLYGVSATVQRLSTGLRRELYFDLMTLFRRPPDHMTITNDGTCGDVVAQRFGLDRERYNFLFNGFNPELLSMKVKERMPRYVLTACRLVDWKRVDRVIEIAALCKSRLPDLRFIILGDGPERRNLEVLITKKKVESTVRLTGKVSRTSMYEYLTGASAVLATQDISNLNNTVLEALVLGKPVVALDCGCTKQLIHHRETGLLYQPNDLYGAAQGIEEIITDEKLKKTLGNQALTLARRVLRPWPERIRQEADIYSRFI